MLNRPFFCFSHEHPSNLSQSGSGFSDFPQDPCLDLSGMIVTLFVLQDKKRRKKKDKRNKEKKSKLAVNQQKYGKYGILVDSDMFNKQQEFYLWLQEVKKINPEVFPRFEMKKMFETFAEDYNTVTLPHKK